MRSTRWLWPLLVALLALPTLGLGGCEGWTDESEPGEARSPLDDDWRSAERWIEEWREAPAGNPLVDRAHGIFARLRTIFDGAGGRLLVLAPEAGRMRAGSPFAAALPDGNVILNWEALELCYRGVSAEQGDSRLALVLSHELGHLRLGHQWFLDAAAMALSFEGEDEVVQALQEDLGTSAQEARKLELQADEEAVVGMAIAGYDPAVVLEGDESFFAEWVGTPTGQFAYQDDSHPSASERTTNARGRLTRAAAKLPVFHRGMKALESRDYQEAVDAFEEVKRAFGSREVFSNLGLSYYQLAAEALARCDGALIVRWRMPVAIDPETILGRTVNRGEERSDCYDREDYLDAFERAEEALQEACRQDEEYLAARLNLAALHMLDDRPTWAQAFASEGIELAPDDPQLRDAFLTATVAELSSANKDFADEAGALEALHREYPDDPDIAFNAAQALFLAREYDRADPIWRRFLETEPDGAWAELARWRLGEEPEASADQPAR